MITAARSISRLMTATSLLLMALLCLPISYEAISRAFNAPTIWVFETTLYAFIFLGFLGNALAVRTGAHFRVTVMCDLFPNQKWLLDFFAKLMTLIFAVLIIASGVYFMWYSIANHIVSASLLEIPLWIPQLAIPLGGFGLLIETLIQLITGDTPAEHHIVGD